MKYKSSRNIVFSCQYHIIFCPKYRRKVLTGAVETRLKEIVLEVAKELMVDIIEMETDKDHIHILAGVHPQLGVNEFVKKIKGRSSRLLRSEFPFLKTKLPTLWTNSYFVSTVGGAPLDVIKRYIENQQLSERENERVKWQCYTDSVNDAKI
jgi:putative transposase